MAACLHRLEHLDSRLDEGRRRDAAEHDRLQREHERLQHDADSLREQLRRVQDDLAERERIVTERDGIIAERDGIISERERMIDELHGRLQSQEQQLAAATANGQNLETALAAEQQARQAHATSKADAYRELRGALAAAVQRVVPADATVLVVSKGDDKLLDLDGRRAWHFPRAEDGKYLGYHPVDSAAAIAHLESLRSQGAGYLVFPATAAWWLDHYQAFKQHLETHYENIPGLDDSCIIFTLRSGAPAAAGAAAGVNPYAEIEAAVESFRGAYRRWPAILDWGSGLQLAGALGHPGAFSPPLAAAPLPYLDGTIDMVVCGTTAAERAAARRVARGMVVTVDPSGTAPIAIEWIGERPAGPIDASIIIPCHNHIEITESCLTALLTSVPREFAGEIIVFDDASTDDTRRRLKAWARRDPRIRVKWRDVNGGFVDACNRAAKAATREYLIFLNNDTEPCRGWLTALIDTFRRFPDAGAVGGKLVLGDGTLQEAGGVIFNDGSAANYMRRETNLEAPLINYVREVDYCSGALLATPRRLFAKLGGFATRYKPAYYEDVDYCFAVREAGRKVYYQPASRVLHREGASCGPDVTRGVKRYQVRNRKTFIARWKDVLARQPGRPPDNDLPAWRALAERQADTP